MKTSGVMLLNHEAAASVLFDRAFRFRRLIEAALPFIFFETHPTSIIGGMGRMRIKKKEAVIPFRETLAFRMILLSGSVVVFMVALYILVAYLGSNLTVAIASGVVGVAAAFAIFYNLDHLREAKIPKQTLNRMKRR